MTSLLFTQDAQALIDAAMLDARQRHSQYIDVENLLMAMLNQHEQEPLRGLLANVSAQEATAPLADSLAMIRDEPLKQISGITKELQSLMVDAARQAESIGHSFINGGHLLLAMLNVGREPVKQALARAGLQAEAVRQYVAANSPRQTEPAHKIELQTVTEKRQRKQQQIRETEDFSRDVYIVVGVVAITVVIFIVNIELFVSFWLVILGWIFSLSVHEFSHALVAYWGGDHTVKDKGYLTMNPLRYTHPLLSIGLPLIFLALGGIGLPGGAVYIERHRLRSKWWDSAVSAAGPIGTMLMAILFAFPFWSGMVEPIDVLVAFWQDGQDLQSRFFVTLGLLAFLQITAFFFNLLPIPPLDGFGILEPLLPPNVVRTARSFGFMTLLLIFYMFSFAGFAEPFFETVFTVGDMLGLSSNFFRYGLDLFMFWEN